MEVTSSYSELEGPGDRPTGRRHAKQMPGGQTVRSGNAEKRGRPEFCGRSNLGNYSSGMVDGKDPGQKSFYPPDPCLAFFFFKPPVAVVPS